MHLLVELHGEPGWVAVLTPLSVDGMIVAASTTLLGDSEARGDADCCHACYSPLAASRLWPRTWR